jgi:hypothetical protein
MDLGASWRAMEPAAKSSTVRSRPKRSRSRVTNGTRAFVDGDGRSPWARRWKDLCELHAKDISPSGPLHLTEAQRSLIRRAATLETELEQVEGKLSEGTAQDLATYATASAHLRRLLETLGIERRARDMGNVVDRTMSVEWSPLRQRYAREIAAEAAKAESEVTPS